MSPNCFSLRSYLRIYRRSVLPYIRFGICPWIMITFYTVNRSRIVVIWLKQSRCDRNRNSNTTIVRRQFLSMVKSSPSLLQFSWVQCAASTTFQLPFYEYHTHDIRMTPPQTMQSCYVLTTVLPHSVPLYHVYITLTAIVLRSLAIVCHICHFFAFLV
jgi:hypothetical protein